MSVKFMRRTGIPTSGNKYYTKPAYGGWNECIYSSKQAWTGSVLYNCVSYAWGRCVEACCTNGYCADLNLTAKQMIEKRVKANAGDMAFKAPTWATWKNAGTTPKVGDIIVWGGGSGQWAGYGHVAVVEKVYSSGKVDWSDCTSSYYSSRAGSGKGYFAYHTNSNLSTCLGSHYTYKGLIRPNVTFR